MPARTCSEFEPEQILFSRRFRPGSVPSIWVFECLLKFVLSIPEIALHSSELVMDQVILELSPMDQVILELNPNSSSLQRPVRGVGGSSLVIEAWNLSEEDWADLDHEMDEIGAQFVDIVTERDVLASKSTYFRALFGNFREAALDRINVDWDIVSFLRLLQFIFCTNLNISSSRVASLLEAATFFGVDAAIVAVEDWAISATSSKDPGVINDTLESLPYIWNSSNTLGHRSLSQFCPQFLAVNFVNVMSLSAFLALPVALLSASIAHPQLTIHSERQLCEAILRWYENEAQFSESARDDPSNLLSQVQKSLLPKSFLLRYFQKYSPLDASNSIIRLTDFSECLDLSGCYEVTDFTLFTSCARAAQRHSENLIGDAHASTIRQSVGMPWTQNSPSISFVHIPFRKPFWPKIPSFENLKRLNLSQCWKIPQDSLVIWLGEACPNLVELILINCPQIMISILQALAAVCPLLAVADFSLEITYVSSKEVKVYSTEENSSWVRTDASGLWRCSFSELTKLSLQGHTEISDLELIALAVCSRGLLEIDLSMCTSLTDGGISRFLKAYPRGLNSLKVKRTAFGSLSCSALSTGFFWERDRTKDPGHSALSFKVSHKECLPLTTLDLGCCSGANEEDLSSILKTQSSLTHLSLGETNLTDSALSLFKGTSLQQLDLRETQVSGKVLASIIKTNPQLTTLDIRGCKRACIFEYDHLMKESLSETLTGFGATSVPLIFQELGRQRLLEDLKVGWRFSDFTQLAIQPASRSLKRLSLGVGGTISDFTLQNLSEHCKSLEQLTLLFQVITEDGLIEFLDKSSCIRVLELQYCPIQLSSSSVTALAIGCGSVLNVLKLEWVAPWILDSDIRILSERCTQLSHLSLVGCKALSAESLRIIAANWCGLIQLKLEECKRLTSSGADCLLQSCGALEMLTLRHNGKGLAKSFIKDALIQFPLLRHLSLDVCDSVANGFETPNQVEGVLNTLFIARCKLPHHAFHLGLTSTPDSRTENICQFHKDTIVTEWNVDEAKVYMVKDRL